MKATIYPIKEALPNRVAIIARPRGGEWLCDELNSLSREGIDILVSMLTEEETQELGLEGESAQCEASSIDFVNVPITDRSVPPDKEAFLNQIDTLAKQVRQGRFLGAHCRASIGRSSVLVVSLLVRLGWNANDAFNAVK